MPEPPPSDRLRWLSWLAEFLGRVKRQGRWLGRLVTLAAVAYGIFLLWIGWQQIEAVDWGLYVQALAVSLVYYLISLILQMVVWLRILAALRPVGGRDVQIYLHSVLLRQIPGGVWHWAGRTAWYQDEIAPKTVLLGSVLEWVLLLVTAVLAFGLWAVEQPLWLRVAAAAGAFAAVAAMTGGWFARRGAGRLAGLLEAGFWSAAYALSWTMGGLILYTLVRAAQIDVSLVEMVVVWVVAGGISALTVIAPSGLGVRELSLVALLGGYMPAALAALIAVLIRLLFIAADLVWGGGGYWLSARLLAGRGAVKKLT